MSKKPAVGSLLSAHVGGVAADTARAFADQLQQKGMGNQGPEATAEEEVPKVKTSIHFDEDVYTAVNMYRVTARKKLSDVVNLAVKQFLEHEKGAGQ